MGQNGSCIQGNPDWLGPYEKASANLQSSDEKDIYKQFQELIALSANSKDYSKLQSLLRGEVSLTIPRKDSSSPQKSPKSMTLPASNKLEEFIRKENHCKPVNFIDESKDNKSPCIKPIISVQHECSVHGKETVQEVAPVHVPCRIHGHQKSSPSQSPLKVSITRPVSPKKSLDDVVKPITVAIPEEKITKSISPVPPYRCPPPILRSMPQDSIAKNRVLVPALNLDAFSDDTDDTSSSSDVFSCPDFLKNLILPSKQPETVDILASIGVQSAKETIQRLEDRAETIVETFGVVLKHLEHGDWSTFCISTSRLCDDIRKVMKDYHLSSENSDLDAVKIRNHVTGAVNQLTTHILSLNQNSSEEMHRNVLLPSFKVLGEVLHEMMEFLISKELKVLIDCLVQETNISCIRMAICALAEMSLSGGLMCKLIVQAGAVFPLLGVCKAVECRHLRPLVIRTLTVLCSYKQATEELEKDSNFNSIISMLTQESDEAVLSEIVGLIAQLLKQWSEGKYSIVQKIGTHLSKMVKRLTEVAEKALSPEMFLLASACLATLSSYNGEAAHWLRHHAQEMRLLALNTKQESYV